MRVHKAAHSKLTGFTLVELLVVTAASLLLVGVGTFTYSGSLRIYKDSQGATAVYETAKLINRDLRDFLGNLVPLRGDHIAPKTYLFPGQPTCDGSNICFAYISWGERWKRYFNVPYVWPFYYPDREFSGPQDGGGGARRKLATPQEWGALFGWDDYHPAADWWLPGFFGQRNGADPNILKENTALVGSWGWPRPDYRIDADADDMAAHNNVACWFYAEDRYFNSVYSLALDTPNIVLASMKFSVSTVNNRQETQLSFLKHHVGGFDHSFMGANGKIRSDAGYGNMLRAIRIVPYYKDAAGALHEMDDTALGCNRAGNTVAGGSEVPYCFDVRFMLRNPANLQRHAFALRLYNHNIPQ